MLPLALKHVTEVELAARRDTRVRAFSAAFPGARPVELSLEAETRRGAWVAHLQGVTRVLASEGFQVRGFDLRIAP